MGIYIIMVIIISFAVISYILWWKYGKDDPVVETPLFYPSDGMNSLEVAFSYKGKVTNYDIISLIIYLANKGYISISDCDKNLFRGTKKKNFKITKLKEYDGNNKYEKIFFEGLFIRKKHAIKSLFNKDKVEVRHDNEVMLSEIHVTFPADIRVIKRDINKKSNRSKIIEKTSFDVNLLIISMIVITFCLITIPPFYNHGEFLSLIATLITTGFGFTLIFKTLFKKNMASLFSSKSFMAIFFSKIICFFIGFLMMSVFIFEYLLPVLSFDKKYFILYIVGLFSIVIMFGCLEFIYKRTKYGNVMLGKLEGLKKFILTAEREKLEILVMNNPTYFYDILPYTYVLGISEEWIKKFETIPIIPPLWYNSAMQFNVKEFGLFINALLSSILYVSARESSVNTL